MPVIHRRRGLIVTMTERRTIGPDREPPAPSTVHNLAPAPPASPARDAGLDVDALALPSFHQQKRRFRIAQHLLAQLEADHIEMLRRARDAAKQTFPSPGGGGSSTRGGEISDPTGNTAIRPHVDDPAERAIACADAGMRQVKRSLDLARAAIQSLTDADRHRIRALAMTRGEGILAELTDEELEQDDDACPSHARAGFFSPRGAPKDVGNDTKLCLWCHRFNKNHGQWPARELLRILDTKGRVSVQEVERSLRPSQTHKPHA